MWTEPYLVSGKEVGTDMRLYDIGFEFADCQLCGASVSEEMQPTHERWHACQDLPPSTTELQ